MIHKSEEKNEYTSNSDGELINLGKGHSLMPQQEFQEKIWYIYTLQKSKLDEIEKQTKKYSEEIEKVKAEITKTKNELSYIQTKSIETIGIFVALFTFISVNIQFFNNASNLLSAAFFSMIIAAITGIMILVFLLVISPYNGKKEWKIKFLMLSILFIFFLLVGIFGLYCPEIKINEKNNNINADIVPIN
jgi:hypothetical protein